MVYGRKRTKKQLCCAIYTRKSTTEGLDQDFTSLDAQRESAESYIKSQQHEGWVVLNELYDDGGFTGANIERPGLQKLLSDIKEKKIDCVVVYKIDRLSRSLLDFSQLLEFFDKNNVTFVSVTQNFSTNTSMGRLTLNILLSFAQFEREIISERTRDKMGAARKKGQWMGGRAPIGYDLNKETKKLIINETEVKLIREIYDLYIGGNSLLKTAMILNEKGYRTKRWVTKKGKVCSGLTFGNTHVQQIIKNVLYIGKVKYQGKIYDGQQPAIIDEETFKKAQDKLAENLVLRKAAKNTECSGLLTHLLKCKSCNTMMYHTYTQKENGFRYRYYICSNAQKRGYGACPNKSINALTIEDAVTDFLKKTLIQNSDKYDGEHKTEIEALLSPVWGTLLFERRHQIIKTVLKEVDCDVPAQKVGITFKETDVRLEFDSDVKKSRHVTKWHKEVEITKEPRIKNTLVFAHQLQVLMNNGRINSLKQASEWLNLSPVRIDQALNHLLLSPRIQEDILNLDTQTLSLIPEYKVRNVINEFDWDNQYALWQELLQARS